MNVYRIAQLRREIRKLESKTGVLAKIQIKWYSRLLNQELK